MRHVLIVLALLLATSLQAQPLIYDVTYRSSVAEFLVLRSPNFDIIYQAGYEDEAAELARVLEQHMPPVSELVGHRGYLRMPVVLRGYNDNANGFVTVRPFKQEIDAVSIKGPGITSGFGSWIEAVGPHELVHALHADARPGGGIGTIIRPFAPDHARSINLAGPSGVSEGIAVWYESSHREGAGRLQHPLFIMKYRAAMAGRHWSLARMLERSSYTRPLDRHYIGGALYADDLAARDGFESFRRSRRMFYRLPFLGYGASMWWGNREAPYQTGARLREAWAAAERDRLATEGPFDVPEPLWSDPGTVIVAPRWLSSDAIIVHARGYALRPGFYRVQARSGTRDLLRHTGLAEETPFFVDPDEQQVLFSRYQPDVLPTGAALAGAFQLDLESGASRAVAPRSRVHGPVMLASGEVIALQNEGQLSRIVRVENDGSISDLGIEPGIFRQLAPRPATHDLAVLTNVNGQEGVMMVNPANPDGSLRPWLFLDEFPIYDISWSDDGRYLVFSGASSDVANVYAYDVEDEAILQLTNARFGAYHGALSPDNERLAYVHYRHERHELAVTPAHFERVVDVERIEPVSGRELPPDTAIEQAGPYRAARYLAPRLLSPVVIVDDDVLRSGEVSLGAGFGVSAEGVDPLNRWAYGGQAYYRKRSIWGSAGVSYGGWPVTPTVRAFREPTTVLARFDDGSTGRIGRERRGAGISMSLPLTLASNIFTTRAGIGLNASFEQERLFDDDGNTLRTPLQNSDWRDLATVRPSAFITYRVQSNLRDLAPNTGLVATAASRYDVWDELDRPARSLISRLFAYVPVLKDVNGTVQLDAGVLTQNARGGMETSLFLPRGFQNRYLGEGTFARAGLEVIQPLAFVDDGSVLLPFYLKATYGYAAVEGLRAIDGAGDEFGSLTVGLGMRARVFHVTDLDIRWGITIRSDAGIRQSWR